MGCAASSAVGIDTRTNEEKYRTGTQVGHGASCSVIIATLLKEEAEVKQAKAAGDKERVNEGVQKYAMKIIDRHAPGNTKLFEAEANILINLEHANILEYIEHFSNAKCHYIITKLCHGGELFERVASGEAFSEKLASSLTKQMLSALAFCHARNIVHRDLKPENFVFETMAEDSTMRLIDFGCAVQTDPDEIIRDVVGSPYYVAPEVIRESYKRTCAVWKASDIWSVGVIVYILVTGMPPFNGSTQDRIFAKINQGKLRFPKNIKLTDDLKDLITRMMRMKPESRMTAEEALQHPWIASDVAPDTPLDPVVVTSLKSFAMSCALKKAVGKAMVAKMTVNEKSNLANVFKRFDLNGDGSLGPKEIQEMMTYIGKGEHDEKEAEETLKAMDEDGDGEVSQAEFALATSIGKLSSPAEIRRQFDIFDVDGDGYVTAVEIEQLCHMTHEDAVSLIETVDKDNDGCITFEEWLGAMGNPTIQRSLTPSIMKRNTTGGGLGAGLQRTMMGGGGGLQRSLTGSMDGGNTGTADGNESSQAGTTHNMKKTESFKNATTLVVPTRSSTMN
jgi:calcium-dependent protein kinase